MSDWGRVDNTVKPIAEARSPLIRQLYDYWHGKCCGRSMPARADIDPLDIPVLLPYLILVDVLPPDGRLKVRLMGTWIVNMFGHDYTGRFLDEVDLGEARDEILREYAEAAALARPVCSDHWYRSLGDQLYDIERLILPLSTDGTTVSMLLIILEFTERRPRPRAAV